MLIQVRNPPLPNKRFGRIVGETTEFCFVRFSGVDGTFLYKREDINMFNSSKKLDIGDTAWVLVHIPGTQGRTWCKTTVMQTWTGNRVALDFADGSGIGVFFDDEIYRNPDFNISEKVQEYE